MSHRLPSKHWWARSLVAVVAAAALLVTLVAWLNVRGEAPVEPPGTRLIEPASAAVVARGAYLAQAGNCLACHTSPSGADFAGGHGIDTPFGTIYASNLTPDAETGIGNWSPSEFWRAMHHGRAKDGRLLYPAFPYPSLTHVTRADSDALYAYLRTVAPVRQPNTPHALDYPYNTQAALAVWRALFFQPGGIESDPRQSAEWNRGKYLVEGLGHCAACHSGRNFLGGPGWNAKFAGGLMPGAAWYAPSLADPREAGLQQWPRAESVRLLKDGMAQQGSVGGPMAAVVYGSTQHLSESDLEAMVQYLAALPVQLPEAKPAEPAAANIMAQGGKVYTQHCASCHGKDGQGVEGIYPMLAGNRGVLLHSPNNVVQFIRKGGFAPSTAGHPQPFGMPPYGHVLDEAEVSAVATYIRQSWGNAAPPVSRLNVLQVK